MPGKCVSETKINWLDRYLVNVNMELTWSGQAPNLKNMEFKTESNSTSSYIDEFSACPLPSFARRERRIEKELVERLSGPLDCLLC